VQDSTQEQEQEQEQDMTGQRPVPFPETTTGERPARGSGLRLVDSPDPRRA
jgi:hypothetical protein